MRLWSIHPKYLDKKGLVALWRESLLAKKVLEGKTKGYKRHPQLIRFKTSKKPIAAINTYIRFILEESVKRGYNFKKSKLGKKFTKQKIPITKGQIEHEFKYLKKKLKSRSPSELRELRGIKHIKPHPLFYIKKGNIENWEKI